MKRTLLLFFCLSLSLNLLAQDKPTSFKVMAWNILHGARDIENGPQKAIEIIREIDPDIILMVETYGTGKMIADSCGYNFHLVAEEGTALDDKSVNLSIYSKFPFGDRIDTDFPFYLGGREIMINKQKLRFFANWFHYLPWEDEPENMGKSAEEMIIWERSESRFEMINKVLPYFEKYAAQTDSIPMILAGDMNSPSHLDWAQNTAEIHNGLVVPWYATKVLAQLGLKDSYRELKPDPITHPGITWDSKERRDEHRIDYIFYKSPALKAVHSTSYNAFLGEPLTINGKEIKYPSDHGIVVTDFVLMPR